MRVNSELVKKLRTEKNWSQEQLGEACGLNLRTIQRLENTGKASFESISALAAVFQVDANKLVINEKTGVFTPYDAVKVCILKYANFTDKASRPEYWWFFLFVILVAAIAQIISDSAYQIVAIVALLPLLAVGTRRLNDIGHSGWWQLLLLVPFGQIVLLILFAQQRKTPRTS